MTFIAALMGDRTWYEHFKDQPLRPHIYTGLIGPPGLGKGVATSYVCNLANRVEADLNIHRGSATRESLIDLMGKDGYDEANGLTKPSNKLWLVQDELRNCFSTDKVAKAVVSFLTDAYSGNFKQDHSTRGSGKATIENPCVTWLFGSTEDWLEETMGQDIIKGGFASRVFFVFEPYGCDRRYRPTYPADREEVLEVICSRVSGILELKGPFQIDPVADEVLEEWYLKRPEPDDQLQRNQWQREREKVFKLGMIYSAAEGVDMIIHRHHAVATIQETMRQQAVVPKLIELVSGSKETATIRELQKLIERVQEISRRKVCQRMWAKGVTSKGVDIAVGELQSRGVVAVDGEGRGCVFRWVG
jgi:hypothetical protein